MKRAVKIVKRTALLLLLIIAFSITISSSPSFSQAREIAEGTLLIPVPHSENSERVLLINDTLLMLFRSSTSGSKVQLVSIPSAEKKLLSPSDFRVVFNYALQDNPNIISKSASYNPSFVLSASPQGEVVLFNIKNGSVSIYRMRFHGLPPPSKAFISVNGVAYLYFGKMLRILQYGVPGWCDIAPTVGNLVPYHVEGYSIEDVIAALRPSSKGGLEITTLLAVAYIPAAPLTLQSTLLKVRVILDNRSVSNAIVEVSFEERVLRSITDEHGEAVFIVPRTVSKLTIAAYYVNETLHGKTFYASKTIVGPLKSAVLYIPLQLKQAAIVIPSTLIKLKIALVNISSIYDCRNAFVNPVVSLAINTTAQRSLKLLSLLVRNNLAYLILSYTILDSLGKPMTIVNITVINLKEKKVVSYAWHRVFAAPLLSAFSDDGKLYALVTADQILYLMSLENPLHPEIIFSYRLPSIPSSLALLSRTGHHHNLYTIAISGQGYILFLLYDPTNKILIPVNRGPNIALILLGNVITDALPQASTIAFVTSTGVYYMRNLGEYIDVIIGTDLSRYLAKGLVITVRTTQGTPLPSTISIGSSPNVIVLNHSHKLDLPYITYGTYRIAVIPEDPYTPKLTIDLTITSDHVSITPRLYAQPTLENTSGILRVAAYLITENRSILLFPNTTAPTLVLSYGDRAFLQLDPLPLILHIDDSAVPLHAYKPTSINITAGNTISVDVNLGSRLVSKRVEICLSSETGAPIHNATIGMLGISTDANYILSFNISTECYDAHNVVYDVYKLHFLSLPPYVEIPRKPIYITVDSSAISISTQLRYKPTKVVLHFIPPPRVALRIVLGLRTAIAPPGIPNITLSNIRPGVYRLKIYPEPLETPYGTVMLYKPITLRTIITKPEILHLNITLVEQYGLVKLKFVDEFSKSVIADTLIIYVNNKKLAELKPQQASKGIEIYLPLSKVSLAINSKNGIYSTIRKEVDIREVRELLVTLRRKRIDVSVYVYSNLGERLDGAIVNLYCNGMIIGSGVTSNGIVKLPAPAMSNCYVEVTMPGYKQTAKYVNIGVEPVSVDVILQAEVMTLILKHLALIVAVALVVVIASIVLYLRKKFMESLRVSIEEYI